MFTLSPLNLTVFWLVAGPLGYVVTAGFYWLQARRRGVATRSWAYVWALLAFAVPFLALTVVANLYDMENVASRLGIVVGDVLGFNAIVVGSVLLLTGVIFGLAAVRNRQRPA